MPFGGWEIESARLFQGDTTRKLSPRFDFAICHLRQARMACPAEWPCPARPWFGGPLLPSSASEHGRHVHDYGYGT